MSEQGARRGRATIRGREQAVGAHDPDVEPKCVRPADAITQCQSCPWKVTCDPERDIPHGYSIELHEKLRGTIAEPGSVCAITAPVTRVMACHYSEPGHEHVCAGWLHQQLGPGNNLWARLEVLRGRLPIPVVEGAQHETFEETLPKSARTRWRKSERRKRKQ